jgi:Zn-dependent protease with chaperone function
VRTLVTGIENFVLLGSLAASASFALAVAVRWSVARRLWAPHPHVLAQLYGAAVMLPPIVSLWLVSAALLPEWWLGKTVFDLEHATTGHEHLHLLSDLTAALEPGLALASVALALAGFVVAVAASVRGYQRVGRVVSRLDVIADPPPADKVALVDRVARAYGLRVGLVLSDYPISFVWGFGRSKLVLSSGLLKTLTDEELVGVLEHEAAHHVRRDNAVKLALALAAHATLLFPLARRVLAWRAEAVELVCDEIAAGRTSAPLEIAGALVKVRRLTLAGTGAGLACATAAEFLPTASESFDYRVRRLVAFEDALPTAELTAELARGPAREVVALAAAFALALGLALTFAPLAVHRAVEALIHLLT